MCNGQPLSIEYIYENRWRGLQSKPEKKVVTTYEFQHDVVYTCESKTGKEGCDKADKARLTALFLFNPYDLYIYKKIYQYLCIFLKKRVYFEVLLLPFH